MKSGSIDLSKYDCWKGLETSHLNSKKFVKLKLKLFLACKISRILYTWLLFGFCVGHKGVHIILLLWTPMMVMLGWLNCRKIVFFFLFELLLVTNMEGIFSWTLVGLTFDFPDFAEKVPEDVREQVLMTHLLPCVKVWCHVTGFSSYKCFVEV